MGSTTLKSKLRKIRERAGISQEKLAREMGFTFSTVNNGKNGKADIPGQKLIVLSQYFNCTLEEIIGVEPTLRR